ncbi:hypothetical protein GCM10025857_30670 [Alicyclobacillus contaminans]|nr:hypothetical protein GCM10025857_30670 [Alicyclobacillus contaminans]
MTYDKVFVIGAGSMAEAFIRGVTGAGVVRPTDIRVINRSRADRLKHVVDTYGVVAADGYADAAGAALVVLAVKPADVAEALLRVAPT